jgi:hypothetical protein
MKRVAAERRLPIEDIKRAVNEVARGVARGGGGGGAAGDNLPVRPPGYDPNPDELRQGEGILDGEAAMELLQYVHASVNNPVLPQELRVHQGVTSNIGAVGAETKALSIDTQAQESIRAIEKRDEDLRVARKQQESVARMFGKAALAATKGAARSAHAFAQYMVTPEEEEESWMAPSPGLFGVVRDIGGDISGTANWMMEDSQAVREHRERALPYTHALEEARYDTPLRDDSQRPATPRPTRKRALQVEASSSSSSSSAPSYGAARERRGDPLADVAQGMKGVVRAMKAGGFIGRGIVGNEAGY